MKQDVIYTMTENFFFDSYALIEVLNGNPTYENYINAQITTSKLNIFEVYLKLIKENRILEAEEFLDKGYFYIVDYNREEIKYAAEMKNKYKKSNLSMTDCIGYAISLKYGIKFLTGDKQFENLENVEFVK